MMDLAHLSVSEGVRRRLQASLSRLSHAYIISGPSENANRELAQWIAAAYVCSRGGSEPCGECSNCKKARSGIHPDIIRLEAEDDKQNITVEQVRNMRAEAYIRPNEAWRKVFIINGNQMTKRNEGQNALLKVLEDGPEYLAFLFLVEQPDQLLVTIRSRCETLSLIPQQEESPRLSDAQCAAAKELSRLLLSGSERELVEHIAGMEKEKWKKEELTALFSAIEDELRPALHSQPDKVSSLLAHLKELRRASSFNVGAGHLLGWLAAGR